MVQRRRNKARVTAAATLVCISIGFSGSKQLQVQSQTESDLQQRASLMEEIGRTRQDILNENENGLAVSQALFDTMAISNGIGISPAVLLVVVGDAFTTHRNLSLQQLSWASVENGQTELDGWWEEQVPGSISYRKIVPEQGSSPSKLIVNITGYSVSGLSLRDQQNAVHDLVSSLSQQESISELEVLDTPLAQAVNQDTVSIDEFDTRSVFRIRFSISRDVDDVV